MLEEMMFGWVAYANPAWYLYCYTMASTRHAAWGMSYEEHRRLMRLWYGR